MYNQDSITPNVPSELRDFKQFVMWRWELIKGRRTKVPYTVDINKAKSNDASTWTTFSEVQKCWVEDSAIFAGIGWMFSPNDPYAGVDLDHSLNDDGTIKPWAKEIVDKLNSYTEISPSGTGLKIWIKAKFPSKTGRAKRQYLGISDAAVEMYNQGRLFAITGNIFDGHNTIKEKTSELAELFKEIFGETQAEQEPPEPSEWDCIAPDQNQQAPATDDEVFQRAIRARNGDKLKALLDGNHPEGTRSEIAQSIYSILAFWTRNIDQIERLSRRGTFCQTYEKCKRYNWVRLSIEKALDLVQNYYEWNWERAAKPEPSAQPIDDDDDLRPMFLTARQLITKYPKMREPVIHGLVRQGEIMSIIAPSKAKKSWLVTQLALTVAKGGEFLGRFLISPGDVLIIDNELHKETSANRLPKVADALGIDFEDYADHITVENLRGRIKDIFKMKRYFDRLEPNKYKVIILDALYRFIPTGEGMENDNGMQTQIFNELDKHATRLNCVFIIVHHASKGNQSEKAITDLGAGAGALSRATDTHLVLREHEEKDCSVVDGAIRSFAPVDPCCIRWQYPVWTPAPELDPTKLQTSRRKNGKAAEVEKMTAVGFTRTFVTKNWESKSTIINRAIKENLSERFANALFTEAVDTQVIITEVDKNDKRNKKYHQ